MKLETGNSKLDHHIRAPVVWFRASFKFLFTSFLIGLVHATGISAADQHAHYSPDPFEPTITKEEAELLRQVMDMIPSNTTDAIELIESRDLRKTSPALDYALGNLYFQSQQFDEARKAYEAALEKLPKFRRALANLGRIYLIRDQIEDAIRIYQSLVRDGQADADILLLLGHALLLSEHVLSAENAYRQSLLLKPDNMKAKLGLAKCLLHQERYREVVWLLKELLAEDSGSRELWSLRANAYLALSDFPGALVSLECARRLKTVSPEMLANLGDLYLNRQQSREAVKAYEEAFDVEKPSPARLLRAIEGFLMTDELESAARLLKKVSDFQKTCPQCLDADQRQRALRLQADLARRQGRIKEAKENYEVLLKEDPTNGDILITLGDLYWQENALEDAVMAYERAARISGCEAKALVRQAQVEIERERYKKVVELLEAAQAFQRQDHVARYLEQVRRMIH